MNFKHSGNIGDILYALPCILSMCEKHHTRANLYLQCGARADYYPGRNHPLGNVRMDEKYASLLVPLLKTQPIFDDVAIWTDQPIDVDLDLFRLTKVDLSRGHNARWYAYAFDMDFDLSQPCLWAEPDSRFSERLVVGRSFGYRNPRLDYKFMDRFRPVFLGLETEFLDFRRQCPSAEYHPTTDFLEVARLLKACKVLAANQSSIFAVAECLKIPRVLEVCLFAPTVIPHGKGGRDCVGQIAFESTVSQMVEAV